MKNETKPATVQVAMLSATKTPRRHTGVWGHLPAVAKCIIVMPLIMTLLGAEIELRLSPQIDVLLTAAAVWAMWAWLTGSTPPAA